MGTSDIELPGPYSSAPERDEQLAPVPRPPNASLVRALWSLLDGIWGLLKGSWGVLVL